MGKKLRPTSVSTPLNPAGVAAIGDPGDETQRNFRYQHAYGTILLVAAASGLNPYQALWCEHHEDLLAELPDSTYDAYQVKTRRPEIGDWTLTEEPIRHSLKRFVDLHIQFGANINRFVIVSNAEFLTVGLDVKDIKKLKTSPRAFLKVLEGYSKASEVQGPFAEVLTAMATDFGCDAEVLFAVLKRTELVKGPNRDHFDSEVAHIHLPQLADCKLLPAASLNAVRDELIQKVYGASSLLIEDPRQHLPHVAGQTNPRLLAKRVAVSVVAECVGQSSGMVFRYQTGEATLVIGNSGSQRDNLRKKFVRAGLVEQLLVMERRTLDTEARLMSLALAQPDTFDDLLKQLEGVVQAECSEAQLVAQTTRTTPAAPYGPAMLVSVFQRLKAIADNSPRKVNNEPYECLVGIAGLLTEECTVWWSEKFNLNVA
ncbi:dsDNA nuclease domain-containing protein [Hymenobacter daeguensis]